MLPGSRSVCDTRSRGNVSIAVGLWPVRRLGLLLDCGGFHRGPLADLSTAEYDRLRADIVAAESIG
jgi:hypothetical protein